MGRVTIKDVALKAGVSISTVSNAINGVGSVNEETKKRIFQIVDELHYVPNINGRFLKMDRSKVLGFVTASFGGSYFVTLINALYRECEKQGYDLEIIITKNERDILKNILGKNIDGVFVFQGGKDDTIKADMLEKSGVKAVFFDCEVKRTGIASIVFDSFGGGMDVARYLLNLGHKKIIYLAGDASSYDSYQRGVGCREVIRNAGLEFTEDNIIQGMFEEHYTYTILTSMLRNGTLELPDAFVAGNDLSAIGCIKALQDAGYKVPDDVSVISFDDIEIAQYFHPSLTTIRNPVARQGVLAVNQLIGMIDETQESSIRKLKGDLIVRDSCKINHKML